MFYDSILCWFLYFRNQQSSKNANNQTSNNTVRQCFCHPPLLPICLSLPTPPHLVGSWIPVPSTMLHWISTTHLFANHTRDQMTSLLVMVDVCTTLMLARPLFPLHLTLSLSNVLCVPTMKQNIISVSQLCKTNNASIEFNPSFCAKDLTTRALLTQGWSKNNVYKWSTRDASTKRSSKLAWVSELLLTNGMIILVIRLLKF